MLFRPFPRCPTSWSHRRGVKSCCSVTPPASFPPTRCMVCIYGSFRPILGASRAHATLPCPRWCCQAGVLGPAAGCPALHPLAAAGTAGERKAVAGIWLLQIPSIFVVPYFSGRATDNCFAQNRYVKPQDPFQVVRTVKPNRRE